MTTTQRRRLARVAERDRKRGLVIDRAVEDEAPAYADMTATNYRIVDEKFVRWMDARKAKLPASVEDLCAYLDANADLMYNTLRFRLQAIGALHRELSLPNHTKHPTVRQRLRDLRAAPPARPGSPRGGEGSAPEPSADHTSAWPVAQPPARLREVWKDAHGLSRLALCDRTKEQYEAYFRAFARWCDDRDLVALPAGAETVRAFLAARSDRQYPTLRNDRCAISFVHLVRGHADPTRTPEIDELLHLSKQASRPKLAPPIGLDEIRLLLGSLGDEPLDRRDAAYILVTLTGALRHRIVEQIDRSKVRFVDDGVEFPISATESIVIGAGADRLTDPVRALERWLEVIGTAPGPLFPPLGLRGGFASVSMSGKAGLRLIERLAVLAGLDPQRFRVTGIRRGFLRAAAAEDVPASHIMAHARMNLASVIRHTGRIGAPHELSLRIKRAARRRRARAT
jgi:integrase